MAIVEKVIEPVSVSFGSVILYVEDVSASLCFYEQAFGLARRFFHVDGGKAYGELETGATRLAFASLNQATEHLKQEVVAPALDRPPLGAEIVLVTKNLPAMYARAVKAGATVVSEPASKPRGQTVAYLRDNSGHLVGLCTPVP
jgi:lactoylglutathione lyase